MTGFIRSNDDTRDCKKPVVWVVIVTSLLTTSITIFFNIRKINTDLIKGTGAAVVKEEKTNYLLRSPAVIIAGTQKGVSYKNLHISIPIFCLCMKLLSLNEGYNSFEVLLR